MSESRTLTGQWPVADGQRPRWSAIVRRLELVALVPTLAWVLLAQLSWWPVPPTNDFGKFYYGARLWLQGDSMYGPSRATWVTLEQGFGLQLWNLNPPHFQLLILPLTSVTPGAAYFIWAGVNFLAGMIALHWIVTTLEWRLPTGRRRVWLLAALLSAAPTWATAATGQFMGLLLLLMTWVWREWRAQRWERAAIGIGIACSMKLFFAPLIGYLLVTRRWRAAGVALASCAACFGVGLLAFGWSEYVAWGRVLTEVSWPWFPMNTSIVAPFTRYAYAEQAWWYQGLPDTRSAMQIGLLVAAPLALLGGLVAWRDRNHQRALLVLLSTILLTFPTGWVYYWWMLAGPIAGLWHRSDARRAALRLLPVAFLPFWWFWPIDSPILAFTIGSAFTWALLAFWIGLIRSSWRDA
jgi:alpha-1,2-mannosyltransferase